MNMAAMRQASQLVFDNFINNGSTPGLPPICGKWYHVAPRTGSDNANGQSLQTAFASFEKAVAVLKARATAAGVNGLGDGIVLWSQGTTTAHCTSYLTAAMTFDLSNVTVVGMCAPTMFAQRARISNKATTLEDATTLITISGSNNRFYNLSIYNGGTTGVGCVAITGNRNYFYRVHFIGGGGVTSAGTTDNDLTLTGASENTFDECVIGSDTKDRGNNASANLHLATGCMRNFWNECIFLSYHSSGTSAGAIKRDGAGDAIYRDQFFKNCIFDCYDEANGSAQTSLVIGTASNNGCIIIVGSGTIMQGYADYCAAGDARVLTNLAAAADTGGKALAQNPS